MNLKDKASVDTVETRVRKIAHRQTRLARLAKKRRMRNEYFIKTFAGGAKYSLVGI